jgi:shikimate kinase
VTERSGHVALVGLSGSGKSTVAPLLASRLGRRSVVDLDRVIEERHGATVAEIFATQGEAGFRSAETEALAEALADADSVIATGGGAVLSAENRAMLASDAYTVWLRAHPDHLRQRLSGTTEARPLLEGDPAFALTRLANERDALYSAVADLIVDVEGLDPAGVVDEIVDAFG